MGVTELFVLVGVILLWALAAAVLPALVHRVQAEGQEARWDSSDQHLSWCDRSRLGLGARGGHQRRNGVERPSTAPSSTSPSAIASASGFCTKCGARLANEARFCGKCGQPVTELGATS